MTAPAQIGPYQVVRELGRGGMGVVLEVRHPAAPQRLALKVVNDAGVTAEGLARFEREAQLLVRVQHPNVLRVHAFARERGRPYLVTDLVEGRKLSQVAREGPVAPRRAAAIVAALASGVAAMHEKEILHRDLKPDNVILRADDSPVLLDFGLARELDARSLTQTGAVLGTPAYMAPEQAAGKGEGVQDTRTDVYGLGAILFELLAGRPPFDDVVGEMQKVVAVLNKEPRWPGETRKDVPRELEAILRRAMAKQRVDRYPNALALGLDLERFARGEKTEAAPGAPKGRIALLASIAALLVAAVAVAAWALSPREHHPVAPPAPPPAPAPPPPPPPPPPPSQPDPPEAPNDGVPGVYRQLVAWLAKDDGSRPKVTERVLARLEAVRQRGRLKLIELPVSRHPENKGLVRVRFISERWLAILQDLDTVHVVDLDAPVIRPRPVWTLFNDKNLRAEDLVVAGVKDGEARVFLATSNEVYETTFSLAEGSTQQERPEKVVGATRTKYPVVIALSPSGRTLAYNAPAKTVEIQDLSSDGPPARIPIEPPPSVVGDAKGRDVRGLEFISETELLVACTKGAGTESQSWLALYDTSKGVLLRTTTESLAGDTYGSDFSRRRSVIYASVGANPCMVFPPTLAKHAAVIGPEIFGPRIALGGLKEDVIYSAARVGELSFSAWRAAAPEKPLRNEPRRADATDSIEVSPGRAFVAVGGRVDGKQVAELWPAGD